MASKLALLLTLVALSVAHSAAALAPSPAPDCSSVLLSLAGCLEYVSEGSTTSKPGSVCCSGLTTVLKMGEETVVHCLCDAFKNGQKEYDVQLNTSREVELPAACKVNFSVQNSCHIGLPNATAPVPAHSPQAISPSPSLPGTPTTSVQGTPSASVLGTPSSSSGSGESPGSSSLATSVALLVLNVMAALFLT